jgi:hypothetical protein
MVLTRHSGPEEHVRPRRAIAESISRFLEQFSDGIRQGDVTNP